MESIKKLKLINEYVEGENVKDIFVVKIKKGISDYSRGFYFALILTDSSGKSIDYRYWGGVDEEYVREIYNSIGDDSVVYIEGKFSFYNGKPQIVSNDKNEIRVLEEGHYKKEDFIKRSKKDLNILIKKIENYIYKIQNPEIRKLIESIFNEDFKEKYKLHPGAISIHHNWIGGLIEHTLEILKYCEVTKEMFPDLNEDLMIAGALLHDIGKLEEMEMTTRIKGTNKGMFLGHLVIGANMVSKKMDELETSEGIRNKILHLIVSHHGSMENGSPKEPMFPEAIALYHADEMSTRIAEMLNFIDQNKDETEDDFMYDWKKGKNIFLR
jgi:3'-5' exoribonuclease